MNKIEIKRNCILVREVREVEPKEICKSLTSPKTLKFSVI